MEQDDELFLDMNDEYLADLFADSIGRAEAGEPIEAILADAPEKYRADLSEFLNLAGLVLNQRQAPLPPRNQAKQAAGREAFLRAAAADRAEHLAAQVVPRAARQTTPTRQRTSGWLIPLAWLNQAWEKFQQATTFHTYRFAPLIVTLAIAFIAALSMVSVTQAAMLGDFAYPVKDWARSASLVLAPPERRAELLHTINQEVAAEIVAAARRSQQSADGAKDLSDLVTEATFTVPFQGFQGSQLLLGDMIVFPTYQPNADLQQRADMMIEGELTEGALVEVTVRILPGQTQYVQGVRAKVLSPPAPAPQPTATPQSEGGAPQNAVNTPTAIPIPTRELNTRRPCQPRRPAGWGSYTVQRGDTLYALANQWGSTFKQISDVNCLISDIIIVGQTLYVPRTHVVATPTPTQAPPTATPVPATATPTQEASPTATSTTLTATPTQEAPPTATGETTSAATPQAPAAETQTPVETPTQTPTHTPTGATVEPTNTPTAEATATPVNAATATATPTATATVAEGATTPATNTEATAEPTGPPTETSPAATATETPLATPTLPPTPTDTAPPTETPTPIPAPVEPAPPTTNDGAAGAGAPPGEPASVESAPVEPAPVEPPPSTPTSPPPTETPAGNSG